MEQRSESKSVSWEEEWVKICHQEGNSSSSNGSKSSSDTAIDVYERSAKSRSVKSGSTKKILSPTFRFGCFSVMGC